jgi:hypothetical protein
MTLLRGIGVSLLRLNSDERQKWREKERRKMGKDRGKIKQEKGRFLELSPLSIKQLPEYLSYYLLVG